MVLAVHFLSPTIISIIELKQTRSSKVQKPQAPPGAPNRGSERVKSKVETCQIESRNVINLKFKCGKSKAQSRRTKRSTAPNRKFKHTNRKSKGTESKSSNLNVKGTVTNAQKPHHYFMSNSAIQVI